MYGLHGLRGIVREVYRHLHFLLQKLYEVDASEHCCVHPGAESPFSWAAICSEGLGEIGRLQSFNAHGKNSFYSPRLQPDLTFIFDIPVFILRYLA